MEILGVGIGTWVCIIVAFGIVIGAFWLYEVGKERGRKGK